MLCRDDLPQRISPGLVSGGIVVRLYELLDGPTGPYHDLLRERHVRSSSDVDDLAPVDVAEFGRLDVCVAIYCGDSGWRLSYPALRLVS